MPTSGSCSHPSQPRVVVVVAGLLAIAPSSVRPVASRQVTEGDTQPSTRPVAPVRDATQILASTRTVLGDVLRVKTFTATGHTRQLRGRPLTPIALEIAAELPDRYVRIDEVPVQDGAPTTVGFNGEELIQPPPTAIPPRPSARTGAAPTTQMDAMRRARVTAIRHDFVRLMLGMFGAPLGSYPLTFAYVGSGDAPQGVADVVEARGPANLSLRLFIYKDTHLPAMVTWFAQVQGKAVEHRMVFSDYRDVNGLRLPFRHQRGVGADLVEETVVDHYRINVKIDARRFEVPR